MTNFFMPPIPSRSTTCRSLAFAGEAVVVAVQLGLVVGITLRDVVPPVPPRRRDRATVSRCSRGDLDNVVGAGIFEGVDDVVSLLI
jgi:hypothetical protein